MGKHKTETMNGNLIYPDDAAPEHGDAKLREQRAKSLVAMGLVVRDGDRFRITTAAMRGHHQNFEVWRDENRRVCCSCSEFDEMSAADPAFRCEHILAVKHSLTGEASNNGDHSQRMEEGEIFAPPTENLIEMEANHQEDRLENMEEHQNELPQSRPEIEKAQSAPRGFSEVLRTLRRPIDSRLIKTRDGWTDYSGHTHQVEYVEWHTVADILDRVAPDWSHSVRSVTQLGDLVAVVAAITIGDVTREGVGTGSAENETGIKKAEHDALKRAAVKFGIARDLYQRESEVMEDPKGFSSPQSPPRDPLAKTLTDLVTPKQLRMIRALSREIGCDPDQECQALMRCGTEGLSKRAASSLIDHLKRKQQKTEPEEVRDDLRQAS